MALTLRGGARAWRLGSWPLVAALAVCLLAPLPAGAAAAAESNAPSAEPSTPPAAPSPSAAEPAATPIERRVIGQAVSGRPIQAWLVGDPVAPRKVLIVGCIHGTERAGLAVSRRLRGGSVAPPAGTVWWVIDTVNPDRCLGSRVARGNARGVDLNRNAPWNWRVLDPPGGLYYAGPKALSEPESRAVNRVVREVRPDVSIWFHQQARMVNLTSANDRAIVRRYGRTAGLPAREYAAIPGSITTWQNAKFPKATAFVVELPAGAMSPAAVRRHVRAVGGL